MTLAWVDATGGAAGDMLLGALEDLGAVDVAGVVAALRVDASATVARSSRGRLAAVAVRITPGPDQPRRTWRDVRALLRGADLPAAVRDRALAVFARLAGAEGGVHGTDPEDVHFHEVGAVDALVDVVGVCWGLHALGVQALHATPVALGGGTVRAGHGVLPVPAPAVLRLLADAGAPSYGGPVDVELCTPTGAALLAEHVRRWGPMPAMVVERVGVGAGTRELPGRANVVRVVVGSAWPPGGAAGPLLLLETNIDDLDPRLWPLVLASLLEAGASDAWLTPILMKKGRPAHTLSVLVPAERADGVRHLVFTETTSLGLREQVVGKTALDRATRTVSVDGVAVRVKLGLLGGAVVNAQPEYEDVAAAAVRLGRPVKAVLAAAIAAARHLGPD